MNVALESRYKPDDAIDLPQRGTDEPYRLYASVIDRYQAMEGYRHINVRGELNKMSVWLMANPSKRKSNTRRFVANWLNKAASIAATAPKNHQDRTAAASSAHRERVQAQAREERAKGTAAEETGRAALAEAMRVLRGSPA